jgi:hypothetical protein
LEARTAAAEEEEEEGLEEEEEKLEQASSDFASSSASRASLALAPPEAGCCVKCLAFSRARWSSLESSDRIDCASAETAGVKLGVVVEGEVVDVET